MTNEQKTNGEKTTITTWYIFAHTNHTKNVEKQRTKWISNWRFLLHFRINYNPALGMIGYKWNMVHIRLLQLIAPSPPLDVMEDMQMHFIPIGCGIAVQSWFFMVVKCNCHWICRPYNARRAKSIQRNWHENVDWIAVTNS